MNPNPPHEVRDGATAGTPSQTPIGERPPALPPSGAQNVRFRPLNRQESAIRLRRLRPRAPAPPRPTADSNHPHEQLQRREDNGAPIPAPTQNIPVDETDFASAAPGINTRPGPRPGGLGRLFTRRHQAAQPQPTARVVDDDCYDSRVVDYLDVIDPEVATLSSITNIQNSLFVPSLGKWVNRRPTYDLSQLPTAPGAYPESTEDVTKGETSDEGERPAAGRVHSLSSVLTAPQYAILPNDASLEGWREEDIKLLNDHVRHMLQSRRSKIKQSFKGFLQYARRPLGFFVTVYATLITLFGLAWVLFLIGWIYVGDRQLYVINVIDYILVALFAIVGDGLAPFRAVDTYHMIYVAHYHRKTWEMRKKLLLPKLKDHNDLPIDKTNPDPSDLEAGRVSQGQQQGQQKDDFFPVLSDKEQAKLVHHQEKLAKSHTFYKPHETETHHAFPLRLLIAVVVLLDLHSCLQISLGACTWGIDYRVRPTALTTVILCCSIAANSAAGLLITIGDRRTRKKDVIERLLKQDLTQQAMKKIQKEKEKGDKAQLNINLPFKEGEKGRVSVELPWREGERSSSSSDTTRKEKDQVGKFDTGGLPRLSEERQR
ncbi:hypothetical protein QBC46DRAFT_257821 [Diplogelasinospora grovesii]|uniref:Integral membrane protein n=1 Tax=Diplogelasinospora grovesii TaxID=303347 RepID=A0AAN6N9R5_9PEZI|nr:hypothetical protein QBC46DRAFT_257821 [Diplogelasinospora grovesii]